MGFLSALTIVFVVFKILGYLDWSWFLVFLPTIINVFFIGLNVILKNGREEDDVR